eukprot:2015277-Rhodomonas_salina.2
MSSTEIAYDGTEIAYDGTEIAYGGTEIAYGAYGGTEIAYSGTEVAYDGTEIAYGDTEIAYGVGGSGYEPSQTPQVTCAISLPHHTPCPIPHDPVSLCACYAMSGTEIGYAATAKQGGAAHVQRRYPYLPTKCYAMSGTGIAYSAVRLCDVRY